MQDEPSEWHQGIVFQDSRRRDFGWIKCPELNRVFVHISSFKNRPPKIRKGMVIRFRFVADKPSPRAVDAEMIS